MEEMDQEIRSSMDYLCLRWREHNQNGNLSELHSLLLDQFQAWAMKTITMALQASHDGLGALDLSIALAQLYEMKGEVQPELTIYCEDEVAAALIQESLSYDDQIRTRILPVGSDVTVIRQGVSHLRGGYEGKCLCIMDGDCDQRDILKRIVSEKAENVDLDPDFIVLPGEGIPPEKWILEQLKIEDYRNQFADNLGCPKDVAREHVKVMASGLDHHDISYTPMFV